MKPYDEIIFEKCLPIYLENDLNFFKKVVFKIMTDK